MKLKTEKLEVLMTTNKTYTPILIDSVLAAADLQQKRFVGFDGNCCTAGAKALGVVDVTTEKGQYVPVCWFIIREAITHQPMLLDLSLKITKKNSQSLS